jgi:hypothetical protein
MIIIGHMITIVYGANFKMAEAYFKYLITSTVNPKQKIFKIAYLSTTKWEVYECDIY